MTTTQKSVQDRQAALEGVILPHAAFKAALRKLGNLGSRATYERELAGRLRVVIGGAGAGKTQILRAVLGQPWAKATLDGREGDRRPALFVEVPDTYSDRALVAGIMGAMGEEAPKSWSKEQILDELAKLFEGVGLRVLLLDEAHWMMMSDNLKVQRQAAEFLKSLTNRTGVHIILAGVEELARLYNHDFSQTRRRMLTKVHLKPYNWSVAKERVRFQAILKLYEEALAYPTPSGLDTLDMSRRLYLVSGGELGVVVQYLSQAVEEAAEGNDRSITLEALGAVYEGLRPELGRVVVGSMDTLLPEQADEDRATNPFLCDAGELKVLWEARFLPKPANPDNSRPTRLKPGSQPTV